MINTLSYILEKFNLDYKGCQCEHLPTEHVHEVLGCLKCPCERYHANLPLSIPNFGRDQLPALFRELGFTVGAEVGVMEGKYSEVLTRNYPELHLFCVDSWAEYRGYGLGDQKTMDIYFARAKRRLIRRNVTFVRKFSVEAAKDFADGSLSWVYIDAAHDFVNVVNDLAAWIPKVHSQGLICGHDYVQRGMGPTIFGKANKTFHVKQAVEGYTSAYLIDPWFVLGRAIPRDGEVRDKIRSWFWVKE